MASKEMTEEEKKLKAQQKAERKKAFEAQRALEKMKIENKADAKQAKNKADLKKERRAVQEAQRAAKGGGSVQLNDGDKVAKVTAKQSEPKHETLKLEAKKEVLFENRDKTQTGVKKVKGSTTKTKSTLKIKLDTKEATATTKKQNEIFPHIPYKKYEIGDLTKELGFTGQYVHPSIIKVGLRINSGVIRGSTLRCVAMLEAFKHVIKDYTTPPQKTLTRDLEEKLDYYIDFLNICRPLAVSMVNSIKILKHHLSKINADNLLDDQMTKDYLIKNINNIIEEAHFAQLAIAKVFDETNIFNDDVILTFGCSLIVQHVLYKAMKSGKSFRVIVADSRPKLLGKDMINFLLKHRIPSTYLYINSVAYAMKEVTKVVFGAHAVLANGYVMAKLGTSQIALVAHAYNVPVLVCCETFKFSERVHTDSFVNNESGPINEFFEYAKDSNLKEVLNNKEKKLDVNILNIVYDVTPPDFVSLITTEKGNLPRHCVPAVIRRNFLKI